MLIPTEGGHHDEPGRAHLRGRARPRAGRGGLRPRLVRRSRRRGRGHVTGGPSTGRHLDRGGPHDHLDGATGVDDHADGGRGPGLPGGRIRRCDPPTAPTAPDLTAVERQLDAIEQDLARLDASLQAVDEGLAKE
ncbi:MAG: hypothetical protein M5U14_10790 [Acidimicrobiia bacterium]|nr:hypothetical protein [Acidimicrobiia bacterium]